jgi:hypothetical protein
MSLRASVGSTESPLQEVTVAGDHRSDGHFLEASACLQAGCAHLNRISPVADQIEWIPMMAHLVGAGSVYPSKQRHPRVAWFAGRIHLLDQWTLAIHYERVERLNARRHLGRGHPGMSGPATCSAAAQRPEASPPGSPLSRSSGCLARGILPLRCRARVGLGRDLRKLDVLGAPGSRPRATEPDG